jgi:suppressor of ftsI
MPSRRSTITRRALLAGGGLLGCCALVSGGGATAWWLANRPDDYTGDLDFANPLAIPPLTDGDLDDDGRRVFDLTLQTGSSHILPGKETETWGINGPLLGPALRARRGETVALRVHNELPQATSLHWHGMHLPARMDGGPHQMIPVGESWEPTWTIEQPAATLWFHPHPHGETAEQVYKGVAGLFLIEDDHAASLGLPADYGVDDIPLIIQDRQFTDDGQLTMDAGSFFDELGGRTSFGVLGNTMLINGTWNPHLEVERALIRFRVLNGSNARFYNLGFADDRPFHLIATDNGLLPGAPVELQRVLLGPGERAEIVVSFEPGESVVMRTFKAELGASARAIGGDDTFDLVEIRAASHLESAAALPASLGGTPAPSAPTDAMERTFRLEGHTRINDREMDMARIDEVIPAGAREIWDVSSNGLPHTFHIHGATFHVLDVDGEEPPPHLQGPKDTVFVGSSHPVRLAVQFLDHTDPEMPYMFHCHILRHEDNGMMGQFVVVEPGTEDEVERTLDLDHHH